VDDAQTTFTRQGYCQPGFGDCIHGGGEQWGIELDRIGQPGTDIGIGREHLAETGDNQDIVKGQSLSSSKQIFIHYYLLGVVFFG